jgi:AcrR family transcriptional regulator
MNVHSAAMTRAAPPHPSPPRAATARRALFPDAQPKEAAILDAALDLFVERGFHGTTVPDVARRARVAAGTIYLYFPSKEDLVNRLIASLQRDLARALVANVPPDAPLEAQFEAIWRTFSDWLVESPRAFTFLDLHWHAPYVTEATQRAWAPGDALLDAHFRAGRRQGVYRDLPPAALRAVVAGVFMGAAKFARAGRLELTRSLLGRLRAAAWTAVRRPEEVP